jgi:hypothetical protein
VSGVRRRTVRFWPQTVITAGACFGMAVPLAIGLRGARVAGERPFSPAEAAPVAAVICIMTIVGLLSLRVRVVAREPHWTVVSYFRTTQVRVADLGSVEVRRWRFLRTVAMLDLSGGGSVPLLGVTGGGMGQDETVDLLNRLIGVCQSGPSSEASPDAA